MKSNGSRSGWLDEFWSLFLAMPVVLAFLPWTQGFVSMGFVILRDQVPGWYQACFGAAVSWGFARPKIGAIFGMIGRR